MSAQWQPIDTQAEPITGWRCWFVRPEEALLRPIYMRGLRWAPRVAQEAICPEEAHAGTSPDEDCKCGIYAVCAPLLLREVYWDTAPPKGVKPLVGTVVVGQIALWGKVVQHDRGWRAQYAYPMHLYAFTADATLAERLREHYQVPVAWGAEAERIRRLLPPQVKDDAGDDPSACDECGQALPKPATEKPPHWSQALLALVVGDGWSEAARTLYQQYCDANKKAGEYARPAWADWSDPNERVKRLGEWLSRTTSHNVRRGYLRDFVLAETEQYAVKHACPRCARRALWVRLVRWRRAVISEAWERAEWRRDRLEECREDLARGTTRGAGRSGRPYAKATLAALRSRARWSEASLTEAVHELQVAADVWMPTYRAWRAALRSAVGPDISQPAGAPWRDWHRLVEGERQRLVLERGLLVLEREALERERSSVSTAVAG